MFFIQRPKIVDRIVNLVCAQFEVSKRQVFGSGKQKRVALARQTIMYLVRRGTELSYPEIGDVLRKDHSTVIKGDRKIKELLLVERELRIIVDAILKLLASEARPFAALENIHGDGI